MNYKLSHNVYWQTIWLIRDYPYSKAEYDACIGATSKGDDENGSMHGSGISDPTARDAAKRILLGYRVKPVEKALEKIEPQYRSPLLENIIKGSKAAPYPDIASTVIWKRKRRKFVYLVALYAGWVQED